MGAQSTKSADVVAGHLTSDECSRLKKLFNTLNSSVQVVGTKGEKGVTCPYADFQRHCETYLDDWLAQRIADKLSIKSVKNEELIVPFTKYLNFLSCLLKGSVEEKAHWIWNLAMSDNSGQRGNISSQEITQYTRSIIESYVKSIEQTNYYKSWIDAGIPKLTSDSISDFAEFLLTDLLFKGVSTKDLINFTNKNTKSHYTHEELVDCFSKSSLLLSLHNSIISQCFRLDVENYFVRLLPVCHKAQTAFLPEDYTVLDFPRILFLNSQLPSELRSEWRFLFSTAAHGESFSKFMGLIVDKGPTLVILRDENRRIFGAFATNSWALGPKFFGEDNCFLFHLQPKFSLYPSTSYNKNFQYLNTNQQTLPNGLGMGGKLEYFGLWIDSEFGKGKSSPSCTTFSCPQLTAGENFSIHHLEVWGLGPEPVKDENERDAKSILDKDPEAKAMLELVNKGAQSDGYRDEPHCNE